MRSALPRVEVVRRWREEAIVIAGLSAAGRSVQFRRSFCRRCTRGGLGVVSRGLQRAVSVIRRDDLWFQSSQPLRRQHLAALIDSKMNKLLIALALAPAAALVAPSVPRA